MSGIVCYIGRELCKGNLTAALQTMKKRGNSVAGAALQQKNFVSIVSNGISGLYDEIQKYDGDSTFGIAECSSIFNNSCAAVPAVNNMYAVAVDGEIENFEAIERWCKNPFPVNSSEDLLLAMLCVNSSDNKLALIKKIFTAVKGEPTFAFAQNGDDVLYCHRGDSPLFVGFCDDGYYVASELNAIVPYCKKYVFLKYHESARIARNRIVFYDSRMKKIKKQAKPCPDYALFENSYTPSEEVYYCPLVLREIYSRIVKKGEIALDELNFTKRSTEKIKRIVITGNVSAYNASRAAAYYIESLCDIPCTAVESTQLRCSGAVFDKGTLLLVASHTGEDNDAAFCIRRAKKFGAKTIAVTNSAISYVAEICDYAVNPGADFNSERVSFREFVSLYMTLCLIGLYIGKKAGVVSDVYMSLSLKLAEQLPSKILSLIRDEKMMKSIIPQIMQSKRVFVTGLGADAAIADECAFWLEDVGGVSCSALSSSNLAALNRESFAGSAILCFVTDALLMPKILPMLKRAEFYGAKVMLIATDAIYEERTNDSNAVTFGDSMPMLNVLNAAVWGDKLSVFIAQNSAKNDKKAAV